ncbi:MAG: type I-B CRISPR-associated protein Cas5b [candidate division WOR-3 bacterium]
MKLLRLKIYQPHAHYRIPFTFSRRHTYPIPPYSTVIGLICNVLGIKDQSDSYFQKLKDGLSLAIYGKFGSITKEYVWLRNLNKEYHILRFAHEKNRVTVQISEHPGGQMPTRVDVLEDVNLVIYIHHPDDTLLETLKDSFLNPQNRIYPLHLGRAEDWIIFSGSPSEAIKITEVDEKSMKSYYGRLDYYCWIPNIKYGREFVDEKLFDENFSEFIEKISGSSHLITSFYEIKDGFRNFTHIPVKLFEQGDFPLFWGKPFKFIKDNEMNIPLFLCKAKGDSYGNLG